MVKNYYSLRLFVLFTLMFVTGLAMAQEGTVSGVVSENGEPLIGATVVVQGSNMGTTTDFDGKYSLTLSAGEHVIEASYVGYNSHSHSVTVMAGKNTTLNFELLQGLGLDEVLVVGSRAEGRTKLTTAVPVDVVDMKKLAAVGAQTNINQILNFVAPSFTSNTQTISDGTDHVDPASLRALGPDQVLVLINGKRRHTSSLVNVNGTFGRGNVGTDLNAIPVAAIDRIEILRDGAAAQYGSDAIAGVINIILKNSVNKVTASFTSGANVSKGSNFWTGGSDGGSIDASINYGLPLGTKGGFINFSGNFETRDWASRMKEWGGQVYNAFNVVERQVGYDNASKMSYEEMLNYLRANDSGASDVFDAPLSESEQEAVDGGADENRLRLMRDYTEYELGNRGQKRSDFNMRVGQSALRGGKFFMNAVIPVSDDAEIYAFGGLGNRNGEGAGFYRLPYQNRTFTQAYPSGFLPEIHSNIGDRSLSTGIRGNVGKWKADFSNTYGKNSFRFLIKNTSNASLQKATPFEFDAGGFSFAQNTTNFDLSRKYDNVLSGLNVGIGAEYRTETYSINAGNENSWATYDVNGQVVTPTTPADAKVTDYFGRSRPGGAQVFPGFRPSNELTESRNNFAMYVDMEADVTEELLLGAAVRYEDYSDFGKTINWKATARYLVNDNITARAAASTGFRAPSLHQKYFNSTSTLFVDGIPFEVGTFSNSSRIARILGIPELKEETSTSYSAGLTMKIGNNLSLTLDGYQVDIKDRVVLTGTFTPGSDPELQKLFADANAEKATFFTNAIDTRSQGVDIVLAHNWNMPGGSSLRTTLAGTFSKTEQVGEIHTSDALKGKESTYFDETSRIYLEEGVPRTKVNLSFNYTMGKFNVFLRNVYFGEVTEATNNVANQQVYAGKTVTDLSLSYRVLSNTTFTLGANNILDVYPDETIPANQSGGRFLYSRRSQQFGFMGRYVFGRLSFSF